MPTFAESGLPGYEVDNWYALMAPRGTPAAIVNPLHAALVKGLAAPEIRKRLSDIGALPVAGDSIRLAAMIVAEIDKWSRVVREANIKAE